MDVQTTSARRKSTMSNTMDSLKKDLEGTSVHPSKPPLEKIVSFIGKPVTLSPIDLKLDENIRRNIDTNGDEYKKLRESISHHGILQSVLVEVRVFQDDYELVCVEGHRRTLAAQELGLVKIPCILAQYDDKAGRTGAALAASIKEDLHPLDRAEAFADLQKGGLSIKDIAAQYERDERTVRRYLKMASWPEPLKDTVRQNKEKFSTRFLFQRMAQTDLNAEQLIQVAAEQLGQKPKSPLQKSQNIFTTSQLQEIEKLQAAYGASAIKYFFRKDRAIVEIDLSAKI